MSVPVSKGKRRNNNNSTDWCQSTKEVEVAIIQWAHSNKLQITIFRNSVIVMLKNFDAPGSYFDEAMQVGRERYCLIELSVIQREKMIDIYIQKEIISITKKMHKHRKH